MKKRIRLYNLIFPIWLLFFFPPIIFVTFFGNYFFDSLIMVVCFYVYKLANLGFELKIFYKENIVKVWLYGFVADFLGALVLFIFGACGGSFGLPHELTSAICYDPFSKPLAVVIIIGAILISALFIFLFNYKIVFKKNIEEKALRLKIAITIAIITAPWTFLIPTKLFY